MIEEFQNVYVRILADGTFRDTFFADRDGLLNEFPLSGKEKKALLGLSQSDVERYAASLLAKRAEEFSRAITLTLRVSPKLTERYRKWLRNNPSPRSYSLLDPGLAEAHRALPFLTGELANDPSEASYAADLYTFEVMRRCSNQDGSVRYMKSRYRTDQLAQEIRKGWIPMDPEEFRVSFRFDGLSVKWKSLKTE